MLYDAIERMASILSANFVADLTTLCGAKSLTVPSTPVVVKRMDMNLHIAANGSLPALCVYQNSATTQAKMAQARESHATVNVDYMDRVALADLDTMLKQVELVAEAILLSVDRMAGDPAGHIWEAGGANDSVTVTLADREDAPEGEYQRLLTVSVPVTDHDEV